MHRRKFFLGLTAATTVPSFAAFARETNDPNPARGRDHENMRITGVEIWRLEGDREAVRGATGQHQVQPLHIYPEHRPKPYHQSANTEKTTSTKLCHCYIGHFANLISKTIQKRLPKIMLPTMIRPLI